MVLNIGGKNYTIEFTIEASLYSACTEKVTTLMVALSKTSSEEDVKGVVSAIADVPQTALTMFYAGLMENHGEEIRSVADAKELIKVYFKERKDDEQGNFYALMELMIEQMGNDDFFKLIGLDKMFQEQSESNKTVKKPQDHKKKATTTKAGEK